MEKTISKFKNTAVVTLKSRSGFKIARLLKEKLRTLLPIDYNICYDLYINGEKVEGSFLNPYDDCVLDSSTYKEVTEKDITELIKKINHDI